jgi:YesN/AraC family two-component response regulator
MQYIVSKRIGMAKNLLITSNLSLYKISEEIGYDNQLYFSRLFKKHSGITPSEYRKQFQNDNRGAEQFLSQQKNENKE